MIQEKVNYLLQNLTTGRVSINILRLSNEYEDLEEKIEHYNSMDADEQVEYYDEFRDIHIRQREIKAIIDEAYNSVINTQINDSR